MTLVRSEGFTIIGPQGGVFMCSTGGPLFRLVFILCSFFGGDLSVGYRVVVVNVSSASENGQEGIFFRM